MTINQEEWNQWSQLHDMEKNVYTSQMCCFILPVACVKFNLVQSTVPGTGACSILVFWIQINENYV